MNKVIAFIIWWICLFGTLSFGYDLLCKPNTIGNIIGFIVIVIFAIISIKTQCFTLIFKSKEKNLE